MRLDLCSQTQSHVNPFWRVDLGISQVITSILVTTDHPGKCCGNFEIRIGDFRDDGNGGVANKVMPGSPFRVK